MTMIVDLPKDAEYGPNRGAPHAVEAEEAVLGCVLINPAAFAEVAWFLDSSDFYLHRHRWIWDAFKALSAAKLAIDVVTVADELERHGQLAEAGGAAYLARLINSVPTSLHVEAYARLVEREAVRRRLLEAATTIAKLAYTQTRDIGEIVGDANAVLLAVYRDRANRTMSLADASTLFLDHLEAVLADPAAWMGLPTGLIDLDHLLGGMLPSDLVLVAGRPGTGKTALMGQIGKLNAAPADGRGNPKTPRRVAHFSLEMDNAQNAMRALAGEAGIEVRSLRQARVEPRDVPRLRQIAGTYGNYALFYDDSAGLTPSQLRAKCHRLAGEYGPLDLVIVDYLQIMAADGRPENRTQEVGQISRALKQLARELNCVVLAGSQLSRAVEHRADRRPVLADLRESGSQEQESDTVLLLSRAEEKNLVNVEVAKQRNGQTGAVSLYFNGQYTRFENAAIGTIDLSLP